MAFYSFLLSKWCSNNGTGALWCVSVGSLCSQWGRGNSLEVRGWASVVVGSAEPHARTATLLQESSCVNLSILSGDKTDNQTSSANSQISISQTVAHLSC